MFKLLKLLLKGERQKRTNLQLRAAVRNFNFPHQGPSINYVKRKGGEGKYTYLLGGGGREKRGFSALRDVMQKSLRSDSMKNCHEFCPTSVQKSA